MKIERPDNNTFKPRICYLNPGRCIACGICQHTYYCDSFLDRVNVGKLPPVLDNRNCSGCGLCAQVCKQGALHLYHPEEMVVLISASPERLELLQSKKIPFLAFDPEQDIERFPQLKLREIRDDLEKINPGKLKADIERIWELRLKDKFILRHGAEALYPDKREERQDECKATAYNLVAKIAKNGPLAGCKLVLARAAIWSQLIWSDPGQVLWGSFILLLQTFLEKKQGDEWMIQGNIPNKELDPRQLEKRGLYRISSYVILLHRGKLVLSAWIPSHDKTTAGGFYFAERIFENSAEVAAYNQQEIGKDRLAGLDIRSCGSFLIEDFKDTADEDREAMAGLPWDKICELLNKRDGSGSEDISEVKEVLRGVRNAIVNREDSSR